MIVYNSSREKFKNLLICKVRGEINMQLRTLIDISLELAGALLELLIELLIRLVLAVLEGI